jgi:hypothetical protein
VLQPSLISCRKKSGRENPCWFLPAPFARHPAFARRRAAGVEFLLLHLPPQVKRVPRYLVSIGCKQLPHRFHHRKCLLPIEEIDVPMVLARAVIAEPKAAEPCSQSCVSASITGDSFERGNGAGRSVPAFDVGIGKVRMKDASLDARSTQE